MLTAIVGINWGDEGKGRMVDLLSEKYEVVVRYQGGNDAGHTVVNEKGKFVLNLLPSGILRENTVNVLGNGMVLDMEHLAGEINNTRERGVRVSPKNLKISDRAVIALPCHKMLDCLEEDRLGDRKFGSTRRGVGPAYSDKYMKMALRVGDLLYTDTLMEKLEHIAEYKNITLSRGYGIEKITATGMYDWLMKYAEPFADHITDTTEYLGLAARDGDSILLEAELGALRDIEFGIYPFTTSSPTIAAYAPIGAGIPQYRVDECMGIMKAYSTCIGEGPFVCELFGEEADKLREAGREYGSSTGRPRRVGGFDLPASKYGVHIQNATTVTLTKLDVLSVFEKIPVCVAYDIDGMRTTHFAVGDPLVHAKPIYEYFDGWQCDISSCRRFDELPKNARNYILWIEEQIGCRIRYVSVGPARDQYIKIF